MTELIESAYEQLAGYGYKITDLYGMTIAELITMLKGCREHLSYKIWKQAYLIAIACFGGNYPREHADANPELVERPTIHVDDWIVKGADNYGQSNKR